MNVRQPSTVSQGSEGPAQTVPNVRSIVDERLVICGHGERAVTAASMLERTGRRDLAVLLGGPAEWSRATGTGLERS
jgi:hypothetical protein